jgi:hypothetical protein
VNDAAKFAAKTRRYALAWQQANTQAVAVSALAAKMAVLAQLGPATGGDLKLSGVGKKGAQVGVRYGVLASGNPSALVRATGPFQLIERDTKAGPRPRNRVRRNALK